MSDKVFIIIVFYNPSAEDIAAASHLAERWQGAIIDNSPQPCFAGDKWGRMIYRYNNENLGIAAAQNIGIEEALKSDGVEKIVFLDQDSRSQVEYPALIAEEFDIVCRDIPNLAMLGPTVINADTQEVYRSAFHSDDNVAPPVICRREVISSGSCISRKAMEQVGMNDARLFIDYVDFEWCWRAKAKGFVCGITPQLTMQHRVGRNEIKIFNHHVIVSSPMRYRFTYRNYLWLLRRRYVPRQWKIATGVKFVLRFLYLPFVADNGFAIWKNMCRGIREGLKQKKNE